MGQLELGSGYTADERWLKVAISRTFRHLSGPGLAMEPAKLLICDQRHRQRR